MKKIPAKSCEAQLTPDKALRIPLALPGVFGYQSAYMKLFTALFLALGLIPQLHSAPGVVYEGKQGPGLGKHIVLVSGDEEYRSEEALTMLGRVLAVRHGFKCTVLFAIDPADGTINPNVVTNIPGLEALDSADMMVIFTRFRELPDTQMKHIVDFVNSGKPIFGIRTATHAFNYTRNKKSPYAKYDFRSKEWPNGFGQQVLGDTWVNHWGNHGKESTRGVVNEQLKNNPMLKGVADIWGPTDVYEVRNLKDGQVLVYGQILQGMNPTDEPVQSPKNNPMMPIVWTRTFTGESGKPARIICSTIGAANDLASEDLRRLFVNACYWGIGLEDKIPARSDATPVGDYKPTNFGPNKFIKGVKPETLELK